MSTSFTNLSGFSPGDLPAPPAQRMSEDEFVQWVLTTKTRAEWVDGEVVVMSPANRDHGTLQLWMMRLLADFADDNDLGTVLFDMLVRLGKRRRLRIPDIFFVAKAREAIIGHTMLSEPPDMIVEIVSPDSSSRDWREKYQEYEEFGVREYWIIDPISQSLDVYVLGEHGKYQRAPIIDGIIRSSAMPGFWIRTEWLAAATRPTVRQALQAIRGS
jgi:Uma2 family endonuclease